MGVTTFSFLATLLTITVNYAIASVTIDTTNMRSPVVLVKFLGTLTTAAILAAGFVYNFTLYRSFRNSGFREQLATFSVAQSIVTPVFPDSRDLNFTFADCPEDCNECTTYTLELTSISSTVVVGMAASVIGTLSVLAVEADR